MLNYLAREIGWTMISFGILFVISYPLSILISLLSKLSIFEKKFDV